MLLVKDDELLNKTLTYNLSFDGYTVISVSNVNDAKREVHNAQFDLILLDIHLPDGDGCQYYISSFGTFYLYHGRIPPLLSEAKVGDECHIYFTGTIDLQ